MGSSGKIGSDVASSAQSRHESGGDGSMVMDVCMSTLTRGGGDVWVLEVWISALIVWTKVLVHGGSGVTRSTWVPVSAVAVKELAVVKQVWLWPAISHSSHSWTILWTWPFLNPIFSTLETCIPSTICDALSCPILNACLQTAPRAVSDEAVAAQEQRLLIETGSIGKS